MSMKNLQDIFQDELKDMYHAEKQLLKALPKMAKAASNEKLKKAFDNHRAETENHIARLEKVFELLDRKPATKVCEAMKGLIEEATELLEEKPEANVLDVGLIASAQRIEHYEIAGYGCLRTYANTLGEKEIAQLLQETLDEEGKTDVLLTKIAESEVNRAAMDQE